MIEILSTLVTPSFGPRLLAKMLEFVIPVAQAIVLAVVGLRVAWTALVHAGPASSFSSLTTDIGVHIVKAVVISWLILNWSELARLITEEGPRLASLITGSGASPAQLAMKMISLVARFNDASVFGLLDSIATGNAHAPSPLPSSVGALMASLAGIAIAILAQVVAAIIAVMLALPQLLLVVCLVVGPFAIAASLFDSQLGVELLEGWAETTASALLALPAMAVLVVFISSAPIPDPAMASAIGVSGGNVIDDVVALANDLALLLVVAQLMLMVLPLASGLVQGRPPTTRSLVGMVLAGCLVPVRAVRAALAVSRQ